MLKYLILLFPIFALSCQNAREYQETENELHLESLPYDYLFFGKEYGFCLGDCIHLYKIQEGKLYQDNLEKAQYGKGEFTFKKAPMDQQFYNLVKDLNKSLPSEVLETAPGTFGIPDAHDQGGVYLGIKQGNETKIWFADPVTDRIPENLRPVVKQIIELTQQIRELENGQ